jgi:hypothetical protein
MKFRLEFSVTGETWEQGGTDEAYYSLLRRARDECPRSKRLARIWNEDSNMLMVEVDREGLPKGAAWTRNPTV